MIDARAVVVAVEDYRASPALRPLDGPASDAARYVAWLRARGVPDEAITLVASPLPGNQALIDGLGLPVVPATQAAVYDVFSRVLPAGRADALLVFWGGHGAVDADRTRRLFYADASAADKRNLDFDAVCASLMTAYFPGYPRQFLVVDACQNLTSELALLNTLPHQVLPSSPVVMPDRRQHVLLAASAGEVAVNDTRRRAGLFSAELLGLLSSPDASWPPDAGELARRLDERFAQLRAAGVTQQSPPYLWRRTPAEDGAVFGLTPAGAGGGRLGLAAVKALVDVMLEADELAGVPQQQFLMGLLPTAIRGAVAYSDVPRWSLFQLVRTCEGFEQGRDALVMMLSVGLSRDGDRDRVLQAVDRFWPQPA
ncbi:hypothetical protein AB0M47_04995 [Hamadaea sp. NPDC051192]|uniref:effector-associated domain 2-containing protein n=1 Tax=Hamadaea sp. NPDC051192 TaxID=3154940 RepID=UPI00341CC4DD